MATLIWTIIFDTDNGVILGFLTNLVMVIVRAQSTHCSLLGRIAESDDYKEITIYQTVLTF